MRRSLCVLAAVLALAGCGSTTTGDSTASTPTTAATSADPAAAVKRTLDSAMVPFSFADGWNASGDVEAVKVPPTICNQPVMSTQAQIGGLHERDWGGPEEGVTQVAIYYRGGSLDTDPVRAAAVAAARDCTSFKADGYTWTKATRLSYQVPNGYADPAILCLTGKAGRLTAYRCTTVVTHGYVLEVVTAWSHDKEWLTQFFPGFMEEQVMDKLAWATTA